MDRGGGTDAPLEQASKSRSTSFDCFDGARARSKAPQSTVCKSGQLILTTAAVVLLGEGVTHVQVGLDAKSRAVGIRPTPEGARGRYRLRPQTNSSSLVDGRRFFAHDDLTLDKAQTFQVETFGEGLVGFRLTGAPATEATEDQAEPTMNRGSKRKSVSVR